MSQPETSAVEAMEEEVDRISILPDDILVHILSPLPTKQAFVTSVLSKRWKNLWCLVPALEFVGTKTVTVSKYVVSRQAAGNHYMHNWERIYPEFPNTIFTRETLVILKLSELFMGSGFCNYLIRLPSLKTLHLKDIEFQQYGDLDCLLEGCPVLEDLQLYDISYVSLLFSNACRKTLTKLNRADIIQCDCGVRMKALSNVEFLHIKLSKGYLHYVFPAFNNLTHLVLNYSHSIDLQMLHDCPKLQTLELYQNRGSIRGDGSYGKQDWSVPKSVPSCLLLNLTTCTLRDIGFPDFRQHILLARYILNNSAVLETMSVGCCWNLSKIKGKLFSSSRVSATCKLSVYLEQYY
ncbi:putative F-box domain, FBD domain, leucine-rich repeat domain, L domain-containing protein [Medicago truncatula]|uniref:Putative F-box domain, FBD domain, leucine-rich repeat domain, L domain-containing protein n=1 Tax=Medicago truncatula TaxID=3880 RepID=A0A396GUK1_MEDTR|nr:putative F-box domain, FBD domain, leucine-rich repeat domain, L domain-containing protein [Medicago truncatula]